MEKEVACVETQIVDVEIVNGKVRNPAKEEKTERLISIQETHLIVLISVNDLNKNNN